MLKIKGLIFTLLPIDIELVQSEEIGKIHFHGSYCQFLNSLIGIYLIKATFNLESRFQI